MTDQLDMNDGAGQYEPETPIADNETDRSSEAATKKMLFIQVAGDASHDDLMDVLRQFHQSWQENGIVVARSGVTASILESDQNISGIVLNPTLTAEHIAYVAYNVNRALQEAIGEKPAPHWEDATEEAKQSSLRGVVFALRYNATPKQQHDAWVQDKFANGWKYGIHKNEETKEHPNLVPYEHLPEMQRVKDSLFQAVVRSLRWKLAVPKTDNTVNVQVTRVDEHGTETAQTISLLELKEGERFELEGKQYVAISAPYINYAPAIPVWSIDAQPTEEAAPEADAPAFHFPKAEDFAGEKDDHESTGTAQQDTEPQS